jgi:hypothetical protein
LNRIAPGVRVHRADPPRACLKRRIVLAAALRNRSMRLIEPAAAPCICEEAVVML